MPRTPEKTPHPTISEPVAQTEDREPIAPNDLRISLEFEPDTEAPTKSILFMADVMDILAMAIEASKETIVQNIRELTFRTGMDQEMQELMGMSNPLEMLQNLGSRVYTVQGAMEAKDEAANITIIAFMRLLEHRADALRKTAEENQAA